MDIDMPKMNGYQTTKKILELYKNNITEKKPYICACTAFIEEDEKQKAKDCGMDDFISKPV